MRTREFAAVAFVVVGLLYFASALSLLQGAAMLITVGHPAAAVAAVLPIVVLIYLGSFLIKKRDSISRFVLPEDAPAVPAGITQRQLSTVMFAAVGLFLIGLGFPGMLEILLKSTAAADVTTQQTSVFDSAPSQIFGGFRSMLPEAVRVISQIILGLALFLTSPYLAKRMARSGYE